MKKILLFLFQIWVSVGHKLFGWHYIDIYSPSKDKVVGITFSSSEKYINKINCMEKDKICHGYCGCPDCHVLANKYGNIPISPKIKPAKVKENTNLIQQLCTCGYPCPVHNSAPKEKSKIHGSSLYMMKDKPLSKNYKVPPDYFIKKTKNYKVSDKTKDWEKILLKIIDCNYDEEFGTYDYGGIGEDVIKLVKSIKKC